MSRKRRVPKSSTANDSKADIRPVSRHQHRPMKPLARVAILLAVLLTASLTVYRNMDRSPDDAVPQPSAADKPSRRSSQPEVLRLPKTVSSPSGKRSAIDELADKVHSEADDWDTEVLTDAVLEQLVTLRGAMETVGPDAGQAQAIAPLLAPSFQCRLTLDPNELHESTGTLYRSRFHARRDSTTRDTSHELRVMDATAFAQALETWLEPLGTTTKRRVAMKVHRIAKQEQDFQTTLRFEVFAQNASASHQTTGFILSRWSYPDATTITSGKKRPQLRSFELLDVEESECQVAGGRLFNECTPSILNGNASYREQVLPGIPYWLTRLSREFTGQFGHHGLAIGDVNGDRLDDLYLCDTGGLPNRLYIRQPDGTAKDVSHESGADFLEDSAGALLIDLDNDGDQDLAVSTDPYLLICENDGTGKFTRRVSWDVKTDALSLSAADYDRDGDLDLYICGYNVRKQDPTARGLPFPVPYHDANNGGRNLLLRNSGHFQFDDATAETGLDENNSRFSMAASWDDFDNDGDLDLYVANDFGRNNLYRNDGGRFRDIAAEAGVEDQASGMSASWGDCNRDGRVDLYVGNMYSSAGNRVTYQDRFRQGLRNDTVMQLQRMARGNTLFMNRTTSEKPSFEDTSEASGVEMGRWAWSSKFVDLTNDGWLDLVVLNGYLTNEDKTDL